MPLHLKRWFFFFFMCTPIIILFWMPLSLNNSTKMNQGEWEKKKPKTLRQNTAIVLLRFKGKKKVHEKTIQPPLLLPRVWHPNIIEVNIMLINKYPVQFSTHQFFCCQQFISQSQIFTPTFLFAFYSFNFLLVLISTTCWMEETFQVFLLQNSECNIFTHKWQRIQVHGRRQQQHLECIAVVKVIMREVASFEICTTSTEHLKIS